MTKKLYKNRKHLMHSRLRLTSLLICFFVFQACEKENELKEFVGNAVIQGELFYTDATTGEKKEVPAGAIFDVYFEDSSIPFHSAKTTQEGLLSYTPPAIGKYKLIISQNDTILQYSSSLVQENDLDTLRQNEYETLIYKSTIESLQIDRNNKIEKEFILEPQSTGLRIFVKDIFGNGLRNVKMCVYNNETFYTQNFPNCGGSIKYIITNNEGIGLLVGLDANSTYYINSQANVGAVLINNHYSMQAQTFQTKGEGTIDTISIILK